MRNRLYDPKCDCVACNVGRALDSEYDEALAHARGVTLRSGRTLDQFIEQYASHLSGVAFASAVRLSMRETEGWKRLFWVASAVIVVEILVEAVTR